MKTFEVVVTRTEYRSKTLQINAESLEDAEIIAISDSDLEFGSIYHAEKEITSSLEITSCTATHF